MALLPVALASSAIRAHDVMQPGEDPAGMLKGAPTPVWTPPKDKKRKDIVEAISKPAIRTAQAGLAGLVVVGFGFGVRFMCRAWQRRVDRAAGEGRFEDAVEHALRGTRRAHADTRDIAYEANLGLDRSATYTEAVSVPRAPGGCPCDSGAAPPGSDNGDQGPGSSTGGPPPLPPPDETVEVRKPYVDASRLLVARGIWSDVVSECKAAFGLLSHTPAHHQAVVAFMNRWLRDNFPDLRKADIARNVPRCAMAYFLKTDSEVEVDEMFALMRRVGRVREATVP